MMLSLIFLVMPIVASIIPNEVCYKELECFANDKDYGLSPGRPILLPLPESPEVLNTEYLLYTRENPDTHQMIGPYDLNSISASNFRTDRLTQMIIHGYTDSGDAIWVIDMRKAMLQAEDVNVIVVNWARAARAPYTQAASNARVVGAEVALLLKKLRDNFGYMPINVHIIGHSMGAHVGGEAGKRILVLRISGMDPAQPLFQGTSIVVKLDLTDAVFVDVMHTDTKSFLLSLAIGGYGTNEDTGHVNISPNGGKEQPGCTKKDALKNLDITRIADIDYYFNVTYKLASCAHRRSYVLYTSSILNPDGFLAYRADSYEGFKRGDGFPCPTAGCQMMGHYAKPPTGNASTPLTFYLNTGDQNQLPRWRYKLNFETTGSLALQVSFSVSLEGSNGKTQVHKIYSGIPNAQYTTFFDFEINVGQISKVTFVWEGLAFGSPKIGASTMTVQFGKDGATYSFCGSGTVPQATHQVLSPCQPM